MDPLHPSVIPFLRTRPYCHLPSGAAPEFPLTFNKGGTLWFIGPAPKDEG